MKTISIMTPAYNEEDNVELLVARVREMMQAYPQYGYEHIFIDNHSRDRTVEILRRLAAEDRHVKVIVNSRNFGHIRSPMHAFLESRGDAVIGIAADFQDPPELVAQMIEAWEQGNKMVLLIKRSSEENQLIYWLRRKYYETVERLSSIETIQNFTGAGLYDREVIELVRKFDDPYPYFRGMIAEISLPNKRIYFDQPTRKRGFTKNNFFTLYDNAMIGFVTTSKVPLRLATFTGFVGAGICFLIALIYLILKLLFWNTFSFGLAPLLIGIFFTQSIMLMFFGVFGEYVGAIYTTVQRRPYVVEQERINFEYPPEPPAPLPAQH